MLFEATMALMFLMFLTWAGAVWASYKEEGRSETITSMIHREEERKAA